MTAKTPTPTPSVDALLDDPNLLAVAPMVYVAWADGRLTDEEIRHIRSQASAAQWLDEAEKRRLTDWLDPERPPSASHLEQLGRRLREAADELDHDPTDLLELGAEIGGLPENDRPAVREALREIEASLGVVSSEATRALLADVHRRAKQTVDEPEPTFDVDQMMRVLDGKWHDTWTQVRELLDSAEFQYLYDLDKEAYRDQVLLWVETLADAGLGRLAIPAEYGGQGDMGAFISAFEALGMFDLSLVVKFGVQFGLFGGSILFLGTEHHHREYLPRVASGELLGGFAMSELGHGSNVRDLETTAVYDPETDEFVIDTPHASARKEWIGNAAAHGRMMTVFAQLEVAGESHGVHAILVPVRDANGRVLDGVQIADCGHKMGLNGVDNGRIWFDGVRVPRQNLLDRYATVTDDGRYESPIASAGRRFFTMIGTLVAGRISVAAAGLTATKSALAIATRYGTMRRQFGPEGEPEVPLLRYRTHRRRLMPRIATAYALDFALEHLTERYLARTEEDTREVESMAAALKAFATWNAIDTVQACRECCGGMGFLSVNRIAQIRRDVDVFATFEGDNTVLMMLVAKSLLTNFNDQFADSRFLGTVRYVVLRAAATISERNPLVIRDTSEAHLSDADFQLDVFRQREADLVDSAARRLKARLDAGADSFDAFNEIQDHLMSMATAHTERLVLEHCIAGIAKVDDPDLRAMLDKLRDLFATERLHADIGWFIENGYIEPTKSRAIRDRLNRLCDEVRPQAIPLVDSFGIPDRCLSAPIAFPDAGLPADSSPDLARGVAGGIQT